MSDTIDILKGIAAQIRKASEQGENTAERVGRALVGILELIDTKLIDSDKYLRNDIPNSASKKITFNDGIDVLGDTKTMNMIVQALATMHEMTVGKVATILKGVVLDSLVSNTFVANSEGFKLCKAINGDWNLELDNITVRKLFTVFELFVQKMIHQGGMVIKSPAGGVITNVIEYGTYWYCEHNGLCDFAVVDLVVCHVFTAATVKPYWR